MIEDMAARRNLGRHAQRSHIHSCRRLAAFLGHSPDTATAGAFAASTAVEAAGMRALNEGGRVSFEIEDDRRGRGKQAAQLKPA